MEKQFRAGFALALFFLAAPLAQADTLAELKEELTKMKAQMARMEALVENLEKERAGQSQVAPASSGRVVTAPQSGRAPALNSPPVLPPSRAEAFQKTPPRFDLLVQTRADFFADRTKNDTFFFRKAELGAKGHISNRVDFSFEIDPVRPADPLRRTYIRLVPSDHLHLKLGLEKAPIGLEELTSTAQIPFVDRSEVSDRFAAAEELGVHMESHWDRWLFQFSVTNGGRRLLRDDNKRKDITARFVWAPRHWLSLGTAALQGQAGQSARQRDRYNAEFKLGSNLSGMHSEFYRARDGELWSFAYYTAGYWAFAVPSPWLTHLQPVIRYEQIGRSDRNRSLELRLLTFGFGLLFDQNRSKFQINYLKDLHTGASKDELRGQYQVEF